MFLTPDKLDKFDKETFQKDPMEFWCVATNAETGKPVYHKLTNAGYLPRIAPPSNTNPAFIISPLLFIILAQKNA